MNDGELVIMKKIMMVDDNDASYVTLVYSCAHAFDDGKQNFRWDNGRIVGVV